MNPNRWNRREFLQITSSGAAGLMIGIPWRETRKLPFPLVTLEGTARERGRIHGEALKPKILELCERWKENLGRPKDLSPGEYIDRFLAETKFEEAITRWTPDLLEEVRGIAEASGLPDRTVYAMQLVDEEWWYSMNRDLVRKEATDKCTAIGVSRSEAGPSIVAQNMDLPTYAHDAMVVLHVKPKDSDLEAYVLTYAGLISTNGVNNRGIAVCVNTLLELADAADGLPVAFVNRGILACKTLKEAEKFVCEIRHASGQAYNIGSPERVVCYECSAGKAQPFASTPDSPRFVHTNHAIVNDDLSPLGRALREGKLKAGGPKDSELRYQAVAQRICSTKQPITVAETKAALGSHDSDGHSVCRHYRKDAGAFTAACTIFELTNSPRALIAANPPCTSEFVEYRFS